MGDGMCLLNNELGRAVRNVQRVLDATLDVHAVGIKSVVDVGSESSSSLSSSLSLLLSTPMYPRPRARNIGVASTHYSLCTLPLPLPLPVPVSPRPSPCILAICGHMSSDHRILPYPTLVLVHRFYTRYILQLTTNPLCSLPPHLLVPTLCSCSIPNL